METGRFDFVESPPIIIKVIGLGGGGCNAVKAMSETNFLGGTFIMRKTNKRQRLGR